MCIMLAVLSGVIGKVILVAYHIILCLGRSTRVKLLSLRSVLSKPTTNADLCPTWWLHIIKTTKLTTHTAPLLSVTFNKDSFQYGTGM